jgi:hypothetical protein
MEMRCAALLTKIALTVCGFSESEIDHFMKGSSTELLELTWHTQTKSRNAQRNLMKRTRDAFVGLRALSNRHDVRVSDVETREKNSAGSLLVSFKTGDRFRQYQKYDQVLAKTNRGKSAYAVASVVKPHARKLLDAIDTHVRNEIIFGPDTLGTLGVAHPGAWTSDTLRTAVDWFWRTAGLEIDPSLFDPASLGEAARQTLARYEAGEDVAQSLSGSAFTRHRKEIIAAGGPDIDPHAAGLVGRLKSVGRQLQYDKRWRVPDELRKFVLCDATAPAIIKELEQGFEYIRDGVVPDIANKDVREAWLALWNGYVQRERLWDQQFGIQINA